MALTSGDMLQVEWLTARDGDSVLVFSGGLPEDITGAQPAITLMHGKNTTVLEMEFCVIDFATLTDSPYRSDQTDPQSILVLLTNDLVAIDCKSTGLPSFENPYAMDLQVRRVIVCNIRLLTLKLTCSPVRRVRSPAAATCQTAPGTCWTAWRASAGGTSGQEAGASETGRSAGVRSGPGPSPGITSC